MNYFQAAVGAQRRGGIARAIGTACWQYRCCLSTAGRS
jgi:hypothetical protein